MYRISSKLVTHVALYVLFMILVYFLWCDLAFFTQLGAERTQLLASNKTNTVSKFAVKLRMLPPLDQYVYLPLCRWANKHLGISKIPGMCPNAVTFAHFVVAACCGRFFASSSLSYRRFACIAFEFRSCLDILDGVIYRAQSSSKTFVSGWGSSGYVIDGIADVLGSLFILLGIMYRYNQTPPLKERSKTTKRGRFIDPDDVESSAKLLSPSNDDKKNDTGKIAGAERHTRKYSIGLCLFIALSVVVRCKMWEYFIKTYDGLLTTPRSDISPRQQLEALNYPSTWLCMWLWRFNSADAFLTLTLIIIFFDKLWKGIRIAAYAVVPNLVVMGGLCQLHVVYVKSCLGLIK